MIAAQKHVNARFGPYLLRGALCGLAATVPMTAVMLALGAPVAGRRELSFPPHQVTAELARRVDLWPRADDRQRRGLTLASHFGYGALAGALYGARRSAVPQAGLARGAAYGLLVWAAGYAGWLPLMHVVAPPWRTPPRRTIQLVAAHLTWGLCLAWLARRR